MKRFKKPMRVWLGHPEGPDYEIGSRKSAWTPRNGFHVDGWIASLCGEPFERVTGIRLKDGELVRVTITIEEA